jgi:Arc/MetJ-type ribon-helix-helix transcriptional regulator
MTKRYADRMTKQIAVKLSDELAGELDRLIDAGCFESRSHAVRRGLEAAVAAQRGRELDQRYRDAFDRLPETPEEIAEARRLGVEAIRDEPWERWW